SVTVTGPPGAPCGVLTFLLVAGLCGILLMTLSYSVWLNVARHVSSRPPRAVLVTRGAYLFVGTSLHERHSEPLPFQARSKTAQALGAETWAVSRQRFGLWCKPPVAATVTHCSS